MTRNSQVKELLGAIERFLLEETPPASGSEEADTIQFREIVETLRDLKFKGGDRQVKVAVHGWMEGSATTVVTPHPVPEYDSATKKNAHVAAVSGALTAVSRLMAELSVVLSEIHATPVVQSIALDTDNS